MLTFIQLKSIFYSDLAESIVKFDEKGDGPARYTIYNYQRNHKTSSYDYRVGYLWIA